MLKFWITKKECYAYLPLSITFISNYFGLQKDCKIIILRQLYNINYMPIFSDPNALQNWGMGKTGAVSAGKDEDEDGQCLFPQNLAFEEK